MRAILTAALLALCLGCAPVRVPSIMGDDSPCRPGSTSKVCGETAGDRWSRDQAAARTAPLEDDFAQVQLFREGESLLWVDEEGNLGVRVPVERIVYFTASGEPIALARGASTRCAESVAAAAAMIAEIRPAAIVCLEQDVLAELVNPD